MRALFATASRRPLWVMSCRRPRPLPTSAFFDCRHCRRGATFGQVGKLCLASTPRPGRVPPARICRAGRRSAGGRLNRDQLSICGGDLSRRASISPRPIHNSPSTSRPFTSTPHSPTGPLANIRAAQQSAASEWAARTRIASSKNHRTSLPHPLPKTTRSLAGWRGECDANVGVLFEQQNE